MIEDYKMFIPFLDLKKIASHPYIFAHVCYSEHLWLWVADVRKKKFYILDPYYKTCPSEPRMKLNKFVGYVISRMRVYTGGHLSRKKIVKLNRHTLTFQAKKQYKSFTLKIVFSLAVFLKTLKKRKYEWDNWTQPEVDHFRVEFAS
ncbi:hypothetical protein Ahy_B09g099090 [Arachis hypogaea]|uniref:Ubiquitin-like protease family profile domain-containing protein n=1 Tax=Arachis hypogaea TaxID=3818 RepID=A0A444XTP7_ARAHY|nr:hypothetical protein Ahy_B09g099090 [Arachis hypogaea]